MSKDHESRKEFIEQFLEYLEEDIDIPEDAKVRIDTYNQMVDALTSAVSNTAQGSDLDRAAFFVTAKLVIKYFDYLITRCETKDDYVTKVSDLLSTLEGMSAVEFVRLSEERNLQ